MWRLLLHPQIICQTNISSSSICQIFKNFFLGYFSSSFSQKNSHLSKNLWKWEGRIRKQKKNLWILITRFFIRTLLTKAFFFVHLKMFWFEDFFFKNLAGIVFLVFLFTALLNWLRRKMAIQGVMLFSCSVKLFTKYSCSKLRLHIHEQHVQYTKEGHLILIKKQNNKKTPYREMRMENE